MVKTETSTDNNKRETFWEFAFWCVTSSRNSNLPFFEEFANSVMLCSAKCYLGAHWELWWKRKYPQIITREKLSQRLLTDVWLPHENPTFLSLKSLLTLLSCVLQSDNWELTEDYGEKGNIPWSKLEGSLRRNCISMCACNSESYTFLLRVQFANIVFWKPAMGYFRTQWSLRWQRKYPHMKTRKKLC